MGRAVVNRSYYRAVWEKNIVWYCVTEFDDGTFENIVVHSRDDGSCSIELSKLKFDYRATGMENSDSDEFIKNLATCHFNIQCSLFNNLKS